MPTFRIDLRGAKPTNGHAGEPEITEVTTAEGPDWYGARENAARRYGIDPFDPAMICTPEEPAPAPVLEEPAPKKRARARAR